MKKIFLFGLFILSSQCYCYSQWGTPNAMIWPGMPYGNPAMWSSQLTHYSQSSTGSNTYDPSIERARIDNDYHRAETYWRKKELWKKHNPKTKRKIITREPFDTSKIYAKGRVLWPVVFKDKRYYRYMRKIENIINQTSGYSWQDIKKFHNLIEKMASLLKSNIDEYPAGYYGEAKVFLRQLTFIVG